MDNDCGRYTKERLPDINGEDHHNLDDIREDIRAQHLIGQTWTHQTYRYCHVSSRPTLYHGVE